MGSLQLFLEKNTFISRKNYLYKQVKIFNDDPPYFPGARLNTQTIINKGRPLKPLGSP